MGKNTEVESTVINLVGIGTEIKGDIVSKGDFRIDGILYGNFYSNLKLVVGPSGKIEGNIVCKDCDISGIVKGNIEAQETLSLKASSNVVGDLKVKRLSIEPDAEFTGNCQMSKTYEQEEA
ncbi:MAG TPA: polymer-forming cytoskeletal protein [Bacteroidales bacterium]|nr:polymer-forming cytoskeletal protein [Bacteroidales bacterium]HOR82015.1 polymer-forming cytoskeletal protein [Bacteroidales bacterium]HPJ91291.1 polymer-forming cytoskeletal protein [Bacteroidales bacterium]